MPKGRKDKLKDTRKEVLSERVKDYEIPEEEDLYEYDINEDLELLSHNLSSAYNNFLKYRDDNELNLCEYLTQKKFEDFVSKILLDQS
jgi:hypothetical protein